MIYVITHIHINKELYNRPDYRILSVGHLYKPDKKYKDINDLNPYINELTGLYWLWQNCKDEYIGTMHYRRIFVNENNEWITKEDVDTILKDYDIICTPKYPVPKSVLYELQIDHREDEEILMKYYKKLIKIAPELKWYLNNANTFNPRNMMICKKSIFDGYCFWLFLKILPLTREFIQTDLHNVSNHRLLGFFFERLFTYYINSNCLKRYECEFADIPHTFYAK